MLLYHHSYTELFNGFPLIFTHRELFHIPHRLSKVNYFLNKHHFIWVPSGNIFVFQYFLIKISKIILK